MSWEHPLLLALALPWLLFLLWLGRLQGRACTWVRSHVAPRFRRTLTAYTPLTLRLHLLLLLGMGLLLIVAAAQPTIAGGKVDKEEGGQVLLLVDASASMMASDVQPLRPGEDRPEHRLAQVQSILRQLVSTLEGYRFGLVSFSGVATLNLPLTDDPLFLDQALRTLEANSFYQSTGSSFAHALEAALPFHDLTDPGLQVVMLSDGEQPFSEDFQAPLEALAALDIPLHTVAVGSSEGQSRLILDFRDLAAGKEKPRVLRDYITRRDDTHLQEMARRTGGTFTVAAADTVERLQGAIRQRAHRSQRVTDEAARRDLSALPLALFLLLFLVDGLLLARGRQQPDFTFDLSRLGPPAAPPRAAASAGRATALLTLFLGTACQGPHWGAYRENERGIALDHSGQHTAARPPYERSIGFRYRPQIPTYNLARSTLLQERFEEAHQLFQAAMKLAPEMAEVYYNDGVGLYRWGKAERDPQGCVLERSRDLWQQAERRFARTAELAAAGSELRQQALTNQQAVAAQREELEELIANPPADCAPPPECEEGQPPPPPPPDDQQDEQDQPPPPPPPNGQQGADGQQGDPPADDQQGQPPPPPPPPGGQGEPPPPSAGQPPPPPPGDGGTPPPGLSDAERQQIDQALARIGAQLDREDAYFRRTQGEQFAREDWLNPEPEIWW